VVRWFVWIGGALAVAGCAGAPRLAHPPAGNRATCRVAIDDRGSPARATIRWVSAPRDADRTTLDVWCETVGPAVVIPGPPVEIERDRPRTLAIVSWNIHVDGGDLPALVSDLRAGRLTGGSPIRDFVVLLQEAVRGGPAVPSLSPAAPVPSRVDEQPPDGRDIVDLARTLGLALFYVPSMRNGREAAEREREDRGNAILSTLALTDLIAIELPFGRHRRVAIGARLAEADAFTQLHVISAHLDASAGGRRLWIFSSGLRSRQARHLIDALSPLETAVIGADLNTWSEGPAEPAHVQLRRAFPQTDAPRLQPTFRLPLRLDYMLFRLPPGWSAGSRRIDDRFGSDHYPLIGVIELKTQDYVSYRDPRMTRTVAPMSETARARANNSAARDPRCRAVSGCCWSTWADNSTNATDSDATLPISPPRFH
jgi:endonuclease/exonuclease/phosphatase family metal-dependent hydrolase